METPANASLMKRINRKSVLRAVRERGPISRAELASTTGLSQPAVTEIVRDLIRRDLVREVGIGQSSGGRPPILLVFNPSANVVLGAYLEGDRIHAAVADMNGAIQAEESAKLSSVDQRAVPLTRFLHALADRAGGGSGRLAAVAVGVPGITHAGEGTVSHAPSLKWWRQVPIRDRLERHFKVPVLIENDVNLMALGECAAGAGQGIENLTLMHVGQGIGAGIVIQGSLFRGARDAAGEVGYLPLGPSLINADRTPADFGQFEKHYSVQGLLRRMQTGAGLVLTESDAERPVAALQTYARMGLPWACALLDDAVRHWAYALTAIVCILNPERVLLAGDAADVGDEGLERVKKVLGSLVPVPPDIQFASLGRRAALVGAVQGALRLAHGDVPGANRPADRILMK